MINGDWEPGSVAGQCQLHGGFEVQLQKIYGGCGVAILGGVVEAAKSFEELAMQLHHDDDSWGWPSLGPLRLQ